MLAPAARRLVKALNLDPTEIPGSGKDGRVQKADVTAFLNTQEQTRPPTEPDATAPAVEQPRLTGEAGRPEQRVPMTRLRARVAERLVQAQQTAAILTTFNEVDLSAVIGLRKRYKDQFEKTNGVRLGLMSFFVKAMVEALRFPVMNASVDGNDIIYHGYYDIGMAVSSPRGLVVSILRNCDRLTMADIEQGILEFGRKAKDGSLSYGELIGGTFSSPSSTAASSAPCSPPPSSIRPRAPFWACTRSRTAPWRCRVLVIRPMMYLALSYDHRIIDDRDAVQFLVTIKDTLENPARLLMRI